jgi:(S)-ureidoglycine aminohydrolase
MKYLFIVVACVVSFALQAQDTLPAQVYHLDDVKVVKSNGNDRKQILQGSTRDLQELEIHTLTLAPGLSPHAAHTHQDFDELILVKEGQLRVTIKDSSRLLGPAGIAFAIAGDQHGLKNYSTMPVTYYILKFKPKTLNASVGNQQLKSFMKDWTELEVKQTDKGQSRPIFDMVTPVFQRFDMHATTLNPGIASHPAHTHRAEEIILMIKGNGDMQIGDSFHKTKAGDVVFLESYVPHAFINTSKEPCTYFAIQWR